MFKPYFLVAGLLVVSSLAQAQTVAPASRVQQRILATDSIPTVVTFWKAKAYKEGEVLQALREQLHLPVNEEMIRTTSETDDLGFVHSKYQLYHAGVKVENATYAVHARQGTIESINGHLQRPSQLAAVPSLSAPVALKRALNFIGATQYMWQVPEEEAGLKQRQNKPDATYLPEGELVFVANTLSNVSAKRNQFTLAWKFDVFARQPLSRQYVYVDAQTGQVVALEAIMKSAVVGQFDTRYSGTRNIATESNPTGGFRLRDYSRANGIETYNSRRTATIGGAVDFTDTDNTWTAAEYNNATFDNAAGDAHFGAQATFDYWKNVHGRNSYDNKGTILRSYVHYTPDPGRLPTWGNARWDGNEMLYGDGDATFKPLTSLDVCAHEIGHGVCSNTAKLAYQSESGALNEGFSDIWGACVEQYTAAQLGLTKSTWLIGEEIINFGTALRSMSDPRSLGQPAYYKGQNWVTDPGVYTDANDYGGVHTNSGVLNQWFFILAQGKSGTNEGGKTYSVTGVGINAAARIAYRAEAYYLQASSNFADARLQTVRAANELFGACSAEAIATQNAWYAVGVGGPASTVLPSVTATYYCLSCSIASTTTMNDFTYLPGSGRYLITLQPTNYVSGGNVSSWTWSNVMSSGSYYTQGSANQEGIFTLASGGRAQFTVTGTIPTCGTISRTFSLYVTSTSSYAIAPNPSASDFTVSGSNIAVPLSSENKSNLEQSAVEEPYFEAQLYNNYGVLVNTQKSQNGKVRFTTSNLPNGLYTLRIGAGKDAISEHIQVAH